MSNLIKLFYSFDDIIGLTGVTNEQIEQTEHRMNVKFAEDYKELLREFGAVAVDGHEFVGICDSDRLNVEKVTAEEIALTDLNGMNLYVIENAGIDGIIIWQSSKGEIYTTQMGKHLTKLCDSIEEYMRL